MVNPYEGPLARSGGATVTVSPLSIRTMLRATYTGAFADPLTHVGVLMLYALVIGFAVMLCCVPALAAGPLFAWGLSAYALRVLDEGSGEVSDLWVWRPFAVEAWIAMIAIFAVSLAISFGLQMVQMMVSSVLAFGLIAIGVEDDPLLFQLFNLPVTLLFTTVSWVVSFVLQLVALWCVDRRAAPWDAVGPVWKGVQANALRVVLAPAALIVGSIPLFLPYMVLVGAAFVGTVAATVGLGTLGGGLGGIGPGIAESLLLTLLVTVGAAFVLLPLAAPASIGIAVGYASAFRLMFGRAPTA